MSAGVNPPCSIRIPESRLRQMTNCRISQRKCNRTERSRMHRITMDQKWHGARAQVSLLQRNNHYCCLLWRASSPPAPREIILLFIPRPYSNRLFQLGLYV